MKKKNTNTSPLQFKRQARTFSEAFKRERVSEIERGMLRVREASRLYDVSATTVYRWIRRYSTSLQPQVRVVVELESEQHRTRMLLDRVAELERIIGQKQLAIDVLQEYLAMAEEELGPDWKKKVDSSCLPVSMPVTEHSNTR